MTATEIVREGTVVSGWEKYSEERFRLLVNGLINTPTAYKHKSYPQLPSNRQLIKCSKVSDPFPCNLLQIQLTLLKVMTLYLIRSKTRVLRAGARSIVCHYATCPVQTDRIPWPKSRHV